MNISRVRPDSCWRRWTLTLEPGDEIFLYTDGVVEAADKKQDLYGDERLRNCLNEHAGEKAEAVCCEILADVDRFSNGEAQFDDITELSLRFLKYRESSH
ncbi:MAG: SpoIIE family protein phosphatase [Erysipelotrichaceae bacterium]|nr:SpoIIE family protein phosphatase [Erysipelotrichaceae bacterium]